jgi:predicted metal-dependent phosphoesterase TrpH
LARDGDPFSLDDGTWLKAALHTHTARSDGDLDPAAHVRHHEWMGFDVCAITDHWTLTPQPSTEHCLVIAGAELAADPLGPERSTEIVAVGISDIPENPGGDQRH